ncbi:hypothetical protein [Streptomyces sp. XD-27]|uniref:hypothetical protein n=1 Tax=Streptomyces sp. XD-27 TaxID=3062779 RepID=UPI0026F43FBF|nr:hypothetical protein [Streptomyces sp. XD-27]WKX74002.1 hypothetical protein Q3Y56_32725 [Streptomyces sp. XD-27]
MHHNLYEFYGYRVACTAPDEAQAVVTRLFGAPLAPGGTAPWPDAATVRLTVEVTGTGRETVPPPYFPPRWDTLDEVVIDTGGSTAAITPARHTIDLTLSRADLDDPIVWGRWLVEKAFLILTLRSDRHYGLHAGALSVEGRAALVTADSGVGKSTFTAWGLLHGAHFAGEDAMMRHLDDPEGRFWGYPRVGYLDPALIKSRPELAEARTAPVPARDKHRLEWPASFASRLKPAVRPRALLILTREHQEVRPVSVEAALELCRSDFSAGKQDPGVLARVEDDLREQLFGMTVLEFGLSSDLDANHARLTAVLHG